jgi:hypothetical protein
MSDELNGLLAAIDEAYDRRSWHGTNLRGSLRGVTPGEALWRPEKGRHNIWEIVLHAAYWKYTVRRRLLGEKRGSFILKGSNWFASPPRPDAEAWKGALVLLETVHRSMRSALEELDGPQLRGNVPGSRLTTAFLVRGIAAHDLYHAGQIQLIKRLRHR